jgi:hypothetical protein
MRAERDSSDRTVILHSWQTASGSDIVRTGHKDRERDDLIDLSSFLKQNETLPIKHGKGIAPDKQVITWKVTVIEIRQSGSLLERYILQ